MILKVPESEAGEGSAREACRRFPLVTNKTVLGLKKCYGLTSFKLVNVFEH